MFDLTKKQVGLIDLAAELDIETVTEQVGLYVKKKARRIDKIYQDIEAQSYKLAKQFETRYNGNKTSPVGEKYFLDQIDNFFRGKVKLNDLPKELQTSTQELKKHIEDVMKEFKKALPKGKDADEIVNKAIELVAAGKDEDEFIAAFK